MGREKRISRGDFLKVDGRRGRWPGSTLSDPWPASRTPTAQSSGGGGGGPEEKALNFYNWSDYVAKTTIPNFEKQTGIQVTQDFFSSNEELLAKLQAGGTGYDVIVPSRLHGLDHDQERHPRAAGQVQDPELQERRRGLQRTPLRPEQRVQRALPVGDHGHPLQQERAGRARSQLGPDVGPASTRARSGCSTTSRETPGAALYKLGYSVNATSKEQFGRGRGRAHKAEAPPARLLRLDAEQAPGPERRPPARARLLGDAFLALADERGPRLHHPRAGGDPLDGQHGDTGGRRAPRQRPQVHKLHPRRQGGRGALQLHVLQHAQRGRATR